MNKSNYQIFCEHFKEMKKQGIPYGLSDLYEKAVELDLPIPRFNKNMKIIKWVKKGISNEDRRKTFLWFVRGVFDVKANSVEEKLGLLTTIKEEMDQLIDKAGKEIE